MVNDKKDWNGQCLWQGQGVTLWQNGIEIFLLQIKIGI